MNTLLLDPTLSGDTQRAIEDLRQEASEVIFDPDAWFRTPNERLGGHEPLEIAARGNDGIEVVRDLLEAIRWGIPT